MWWCVGRADLTSTSYVYSRLVGDCSSRIVADAAVDSSVWDLGLADVEVADHVAFGVGVVGDAVAAVSYHWLVIQSPRYPRLWRTLHRARQWNKLIDVEDLLAEWGQDLGGAIWAVEADRQGIVHFLIEQKWFSQCTKTYLMMSCYIPDWFSIAAHSHLVYKRE